MVKHRARGLAHLQHRQHEYEVREIDVGGVYRCRTGKSFAIIRRSQNGRLLVGVTVNGGWGFFNEDGTPADGKSHLLRWYSRNGPEGIQVAAIRRLESSEAPRSGGGRG